MRWRDLVAGLLLAAAAQPAVAQQSATTHRIAIFHPAIPAARIPEDTFWRPFLAELSGLGDVGGENLLVERYSAEGHHERYADLAKEIVHSNPDVIVTVSIAAVMALTAETKTIPIVASTLEDQLGCRCGDLGKAPSNIERSYPYGIYRCLPGSGRIVGRRDRPRLAGRRRPLGDLTDPDAHA